MKGEARLDRLLGVIQKNKHEEIRVAVREYEGHIYVDVRTFDKGYPTDKGVTLKRELVEELIEALAQILMVRKETLTQ